MAIPPRTNQLVIAKPPKPSIDFINTMDPLPKVQCYVQLDEEPKQIKKPSIAEPTMLKTFGAAPCIPKPNI